MAVEFENRLFINGDFVKSTSGKTFELFNPATTKSIGSVYEAGVDDVDIAVKAAGDAFESWSELPASERSRWLNLLADKLEENVAEIARLEALTMGKPVHNEFVRDPINSQLEESGSLSRAGFIGLSCSCRHLAIFRQQDDRHSRRNIPERPWNVRNDHSAALRGCGRHHPLEYPFSHGQHENWPGSSSWQYDGVEKLRKKSTFVSFGCPMSEGDWVSCRSPEHLEWIWQALWRGHCEAHGYSQDCIHGFYHDGQGH